MAPTLLLDVDGVLQFPRPSFVRAVEREYRWRHGYLAFQRDLFTDAGYLATLCGDGDFLAAADHVLARHVEGLTAPTLLRRWVEENVQPNGELLALLPRLAVRGVYLASNQEPLRAAYVERRYAGQGWLTGTAFSYRLGRRKPDPEYFRRLLGAIGRTGRECLFVDDSVACVAGAEAAGIPAIAFVDNRQLAGELRTRGLLPPDCSHSSTE